MSDMDAESRQTELDAERAKWLTVKEAAYVLRVGPNTLFDAIHHGQIALFAVGKSWRIHVDALVQCQKVLEAWNRPTLRQIKRH